MLKLIKTHNFHADEVLNYRINGIFPSDLGRRFQKFFLINYYLYTGQ